LYPNDVYPKDVYPENNYPKYPPTTQSTSATPIYNRNSQSDISITPFIPWNLVPNTGMPTIRSPTVVETPPDTPTDITLTFSTLINSTSIIEALAADILADTQTNDAPTNYTPNNDTPEQNTLNNGTPNDPAPTEIKPPIPVLSSCSTTPVPLVSQKKVVIDLRRNKANKFSDYAKSLKTPLRLPAFSPNNRPSQSILKVLTSRLNKGNAPREHSRKAEPPAKRKTSARQKPNASRRSSRKTRR